jgi:hypothetical protein
MRERDVIELLLARYGAMHGNGRRYAAASHVRSHAGFDAKRTADFVAMDLWPSKGLALHGHEVKVSRSDWLTELKQPEKSGEFIPYMDYWWLVIADKTMVKPGELPEGWGLMAPRDGRLVVHVQAKRNVQVLPLTRSRNAALLRAVGIAGFVAGYQQAQRGVAA